MLWSPHVELLNPVLLVVLLLCAAALVVRL